MFWPVCTHVYSLLLNVVLSAGCEHWCLIKNTSYLYNNALHTSDFPDHLFYDYLLWILSMGLPLGSFSDSFGREHGIDQHYLSLPRLLFMFNNWWCPAVPSLHLLPKYLPLPQYPSAHRDRGWWRTLVTLYPIVKKSRKVRETITDVWKAEGTLMPCKAIHVFPKVESLELRK